jgi:hypothetical protein
MTADEILHQIASQRALLNELTALQTRYEHTALDPVLLKFLTERFGFNYAAEEKTLNADKEKIRLQISALVRKINGLEAELEKENIRARIEAAKISFHGETLVRYDGSVVTCKCRNCKTEFSWDVGQTLGFLTLLNARTPAEILMALRGAEFHQQCGCSQDQVVFAERPVGP